MSALRLQIPMVATTILLFVGALATNSWLFSRLEHVPGIAWIYLPAGVRLLCTLLFAEAGAVGLLLASWGVSFLYIFPDDPERAFAGGILSTLAPWLVYRLAQRCWALEGSLAGLTPSRLLVLALAYSLANPLLHHAWFALRGEPDPFAGFLPMFVGDLVGSLLVIYAVKLVLAMPPLRRAFR